jgi:hypothetical protein
MHTRTAARGRTETGRQEPSDSAVHLAGGRSTKQRAEEGAGRGGTASERPSRSQWWVGWSVERGGRERGGRCIVAARWWRLERDGLRGSRIKDET